ncbi:MAG: ABC transporter ATP-binding protein [Sporolactobacillus sp.]
MAEIRLKNISKKYRDEEVVKDLNLTIPDGSFTVLVGPSGSGKSTTLRMLAGLEKPSNGEIWIGDRCVNDVAPGKRNIAMVFQNYALYPTMTVKGNIEFGLVNKKIPKTERKRLIDEITEIVGLSNYLNKKPQDLSGGQRQRVALARAMVKEPEVFILDEPLSNLDAKLRSQMRTELIQLHRRLGTTFVYVTHDQVEAMSMGDQIVLLHDGAIQQVDRPMDLYHDPNNRFVAEFIGTPAMNIIDFESIKQQFQIKNNDITFVGFRPEHASLSLAHPDGDFIKSHLVFSSEIMTMETLGSETIYNLSNDAGKMNVKSFTAPLENSEKVNVSVPLEKIYLFNGAGTRIRSVHLSKLTSEALGGV